MIGGVTGVVLARALGPSQRGQLAASLAWPAVIGGITALGLPQATCFLVSRRQDAARETVATAAVLAVVLGVVTGLGGWLAAPAMARSAHVVTGLRFMFVASPLLFVSGIFVASIQATSNKYWNEVRLVQPVLYLILVVSLFAIFGPSILLAILAVIISVFAQTVAAAIFVRRGLEGQWRVLRRTSGPLLSYGVRVLATGLPWLVNGRLDQLVLSVAVPARALGIYVVAVTASLLVIPLTSAFGSVVFPRIARADGPAERRALERRAILGCVTTAVVGEGILVVFAPQVILALFGSGYLDAVLPARILAVAGVPFSLNQVLGDLLRGRGVPLAASIAEVVGAVVTVILLFVLLPPLGIIGAALASLVAYSTVLALQTYRLAAIRTGDITV